VSSRWVFIVFKSQNFENKLPQIKKFAYIITQQGYVITEFLRGKGAASALERPPVPHSLVRQETTSFETEFLTKLNCGTRGFKCSGSPALDAIARIKLPAHPTHPHFTQPPYFRWVARAKLAIITSHRHFAQLDIMAEALALTASVVALLQLTDRVVSLCSQFIGHVRGAERQVAQMITTITGLKGFLEFLKGSIENDTDPERFPQLCRLSRRDGPLDLCTKLIKDIEAKMQLKRDVHGVLKALNWSLKWKDIGEALDVIEKQKTLILLAMHGDAARTTVEIADRVKEIETDVQEQKHIDVLKWLTKVDPFMNHFAARAKHEPGTGEWFVSSHEFTSWMLPGRSLWLHGIPGAGKTVLCSTIIESIKSRHVSPLIFYFDFNDQGKQSVTNMLYSFLAQLSIDRLPDAVQHLYATVCGKGTRDATIDELKETLISVADHRASEDRIWIVIDALDECSRRKELLKVFKDICKNGKINILVTSRREQDICEVLTGLVNCEIAIQDERVDQDIRVHVQRCLKDDPDLCKWDDEIKASMIGTLISKAHGM